MDIGKKINSGPGYAICDVENTIILKELRESFIRSMTKKDKTIKDINEIRREIAKMSKGEINKIMINFLTHNKNLSEMMVSSFKNLIKKLCGKKLFIQRRATIIMNVPGKNQAKQWPHYELMSGISPYTYVIWAPLHDLEENSGVYYIEQKESFEIMQKEQKMGLVNGPTVLNLMGNKKTEPLKFGQAIIFNPFIIHGNVSFDSNLARVAYNVRFQSCEKPLLQKNSDYLKYYKLS